MRDGGEKWSRDGLRSGQDSSEFIFVETMPKVTDAARGRRVVVK